MATAVADFEESSPPIPPPTPPPPPLARPPPPATEKPPPSSTPILSDPLSADEAWWSARLSVADASDLPASSRPRQHEKRRAKGEEEKTAAAAAAAKKKKEASTSSSSSDSDSDGLSPRPRQQQQQRRPPPVSLTAQLAAELSALPLGADPGEVLQGVPLCGREIDRLLAQLLEAPAPAAEQQQQQQQQRQRQQQQQQRRQQQQRGGGGGSSQGAAGVSRALAVYYWLDARRDRYETDDAWIVARLMGAVARARGGVPGPPPPPPPPPPSRGSSSPSRPPQSLWTMLAAVWPHRPNPALSSFSRADWADW